MSTPLWPLLGAALATGTIYACNHISHENGHIPDWLVNPQISLTGILQPERTVYAVGFSISASILFVVAMRVGKALAANSPSQSGSAAALFKKLTYVAMAASGGLALQGIVPLASPGCAPDLNNGQFSLPSESPGCDEGPELVLLLFHAFVGANAFFLGSFLHGYYMTSYLGGPDVPPALRSSWSLVVKYACLGLALLGGVAGSILLEQRTPLSFKDSGTGPSHEVVTELEQGGFSQRWAVAWLTAYWASFSIDLWVLGTSAATQGIPGNTPERKT